jgi:hypothetical protein
MGYVIVLVLSRGLRVIHVLFSVRRRVTPSLPPVPVASLSSIHTAAPLAICRQSVLCSSKQLLLAWVIVVAFQKAILFQNRRRLYIKKHMGGDH